MIITCHTGQRDAGNIVAEVRISKQLCFLCKAPSEATFKGVIYLLNSDAHVRSVSANSHLSERRSLRSLEIDYRMI